MHEITLTAICNNCKFDTVYLILAAEYNTIYAVLPVKYFLVNNKTVI